MKEYRILIVYDVHLDTPKGRLVWAFARRAQALKKYAPNDFDVTIAPFKDAPWSHCNSFDLVFNLEMAQPNGRTVKSLRNVPLVVSWNADSNRRSEMWDNVLSQADLTICNNQDVFDSNGRERGTCCISNGIDSDIWRALIPVGDRPHRVLWAGSSNPRKGKGYVEVLQPLESRLRKLGFETDFRPINDITPATVKTTEEMVEWYNGASYVLCASLSEGTPGIISEGVACGCVAVSCPVGNIREWGIDRENCVLAERTPESFIEALLFARENRKRLSDAGSTLMRDRWSYGAPAHRAAYFFAAFRRLIQGHVVQPFSCHDKAWEDV